MVTTFIPEELLLSSSAEQNGTGNVLLHSGAQTQTGPVPREKRSEQGNEGWG